LQQAKSSLLQQQLTEQSLQARIQELEQLQPTNIVSIPQIVFDTISETREVELRSERGVDYTELRDLLKQQQWQEADEETTRIILQAANRENSYLRQEDIENFPCEDLRTINKLWLVYSDDKFGLSIQKKIYESLGGAKEYNRDIWDSFGDRVGWRKQGRWLSYSELTMDHNAPTGHLPANESYTRLLLFLRVKTCGL
ncbi:MAG: GUN4 domain-containing protein, partial [Cyanobacteria bacterium P01_C01_bin.72]